MKLLNCSGNDTISKLKDLKDCVLSVHWDALGGIYKKWGGLAWDCGGFFPRVCMLKKALDVMIDFLGRHAYM